MLASALAALLLPGAASPNGYSHARAGFFAHEDTDATDLVPHRGNSLRGYRTALQFDMPTRPLAWFVEYGNTDVLEQFSGGLLFHRALAPGLDLAAGATAEFEDMTDEKGYGLRAGLRWWPYGPGLELHPEVLHEELFGAATSGRLTVALQLNPRLHVEAAAQGGDEERYVVGLRYALPRGALRY